MCESKSLILELVVLMAKPAKSLPEKVKGFGVAKVAVVDIDDIGVVRITDTNLDMLEDLRKERMVG